MTNLNMLIGAKNGISDCRTGSRKPRFMRAASFALLVEGAVALAAAGGIVTCTGDNQAPFGTTASGGNGGGAAGGAGGYAGMAGAGGETTGGAGGAGGHSGGAGGAGGGQVCSLAANDQTEYTLDQGVPLPFAGLVFTFVEQVQSTKDIKLDIDCGAPSFNIETEYVIVHLAQETIPIPASKVAKITNIDSDPDWANLDIRVEDAP